MITGDSGEYELLTEAVKISKDIDGMLCEIGVRRGMGTKTIIDAALLHRNAPIVIGVDPYGNIPYTGCEHVGEIRLDYTDDMCKDCMSDIWEYVKGKNIKWIPFIQTDHRFFKTNIDGIEIYDQEICLINKYAMVHLDGPHHFAAVTNEASFFAKRMDAGATLVIDDCSEDFIQIEPVNQFLKTIGLEIIKKGEKKNIYQKA